METITLDFGLILGATVANFMVGALWHGPLFGKLWMRLAGITPEQMKKMLFTAPQAMGLGFITTFIMVMVLAWLGEALGMRGISGALQLSFWVWFGFIMPILAGGPIWEGKSPKLFLFNIVYYFVSVFVAALVLVGWN